MKRRLNYQPPTHTHSHSTKRSAAEFQPVSNYRNVQLSILLETDKRLIDWEKGFLCCFYSNRCKNHISANTFLMRAPYLSVDNCWRNLCIWARKVRANSSVMGGLTLPVLYADDHWTRAHGDFHLEEICFQSMFNLSRFQASEHV